MAEYLKAITIAGIISCDKLFNIFSKGDTKMMGRIHGLPVSFWVMIKMPTKTMMPNQKEGMATPVMEKKGIIKSC